jgi:hypothetical protein
MTHEGMWYTVANSARLRPVRRILAAGAQQMRCVAVIQVAEVRRGTITDVVAAAHVRR